MQILKFNWDKKSMFSVLFSEFQLSVLSFQLQFSCCFLVWAAIMAEMMIMIMRWCTAHVPHLPLCQHVSQVAQTGWTELEWPRIVKDETLLPPHSAPKHLFQLYPFLTPTTALDNRNAQLWTQPSNRQYSLQNLLSLYLAMGNEFSPPSNALASDAFLFMSERGKVCW